jgi:hypothetical protein
MLERVDSMGDVSSDSSFFFEAVALSALMAVVFDLLLRSRRTGDPEAVPRPKQSRPALVGGPKWPRTFARGLFMIVAGIAFPVSDPSVGWFIVGVVIFAAGVYSVYRGWRGPAKPRSLDSN